MRILRIRLQNLTSLRGEHEVDLTAEPLAGAGLFAITGATGAGKTTLLDAVTLALYGRAARYDGTKDNSAEMMSRHTGECRAEVEFEVASGIYRARWELRRAGGKPGGRMQPVKRHVYDANGTPIAEQVREANDAVEELTGLDYGRFLRSALLAQGEFARFLKSDSGERAELLEKLTGTQLYSRLGILAYDEASKRENQLAIKSAEIDALEIIDDDELAELKETHTKEIQRQSQLKTKLDQDETTNAKIDALKTQRERETSAKNDLTELKEEKAQAAPDLKRLERHRLAEPFVPKLTQLETAASALTEAKEAATVAKMEFDDVQNRSHSAQHALQAALKQAVETEIEHEKSGKEFFDESANRFKVADRWLKKNKQDKKLAADFVAINDKLGDLKHHRQTAHGKWRDWSREARSASKKASADLPKTVEETSPSQLKRLTADFLKTLATEAAAAAANLKKANEELKSRRDHLNLARELASIETHRDLLKPGDPCPLCGATEHPHAHQKADNREIKKLEARLGDAEETRDEIKEQMQARSTALNDLKQDVKSVLNASQAEAEAAEELAPTLKSFDLELPTPGAEEPLRKQLKQRADEFHEHAEAKVQAKNDQTLATERLAVTVKALKELTGKTSKLKPLPQAVALKPLKPQDIPEVADAEGQFQANTEEFVAAETSQKKTVSDEKKAVTKLTRIKKPLRTAIAKSVFKTLETLQEARLDEDEVNSLEAQEEDLKTRCTKAGALLKDSQEQIAKLKSEKAKEGAAAETFQEAYESLKEDHEALIRDNAKREKTVKDDATNRQRQEAGRKKLETEREDLKIWNQLRNLIGSADGKKFRTFAQAITLESLVAHANLHLFHLNPRYSICRDDADPAALGLLIEDHHQADARRPMSSLSGGESFLASLALALGLSDLTGRTVAIDTLFIDEGFGSLDGDTLDIAIASLERLRQRNKTVGVISHVALLKDRITTQIHVRKQSGGTSTLELIPLPA